MQGLIDIIKAWLWLYLKGMVILWTEALENIPDGWHLCDGTNGTPDLRNQFVPAAGPGKPPNSTGGPGHHGHTFVSDSHYHDLEPGAEIAAGEDYTDRTTHATIAGSTDDEYYSPPYYAAYYIMKL